MNIYYSNYDLMKVQELTDDQLNDLLKTNHHNLVDNKQSIFDYFRQSQIISNYPTDYVSQMHQIEDTKVILMIVHIDSQGDVILTK